MSTDFEDPQLDELLDRHARNWLSSFTPPPLDGMLAAAVTGSSDVRHRNRWLLPVAAAVLLLVVPLVTVLAVHRHPHARPASAPSADLQLLGEEFWSAAVLQPDGRTVTVQADVNGTPGYCLYDGMPVLKATAAETPTTVRIEVKAYRRLAAPSYSVAPGVARGCSDVGHGPVAISVRLDSALGGRRVTDDSGDVESVFDATGFPQPSYLPSGYSGGLVTVVTAGGPGKPVRTYQKQQDQLQIVRGERRLVTPHVLATGTVHGQPATVAQDGSFSDNVCASWSEAGVAWSVCSLGAPSAPLSPAELFRIANSLK